MALPLVPAASRVPNATLADARAPTAAMLPVCLPKMGEGLPKMVVDLLAVDSDEDENDVEEDAAALAFLEKLNIYGASENSLQRRFSVRADTAVRPYAEFINGKQPW